MLLSIFIYCIYSFKCWPEAENSSSYGTWPWKKWQSSHWHPLRELAMMVIRRPLCQISSRTRDEGLPRWTDVVKCQGILLDVNAANQCNYAITLRLHRHLRCISKGFATPPWPCSWRYNKAKRNIRSNCTIEDCCNIRQTSIQWFKNLFVRRLIKDNMQIPVQTASETATANSATSLHHRRNWVNSQFRRIIRMSSKLLSKQLPNIHCW